MVGAEVTCPCGECEQSQDGVIGRLLQPCYILQRTMLLLPSCRSTESELTVKRPMGRPGKSACLKAMARRKKTRTSREAPHVSADGEEPTNVKSIRCQCTVSKSSVLFCTLGFVPLNWGNLAFRERTSNGGWRAYVTDPTHICRHGSCFPHTRVSTHLRSLPLTTSICNFTDCPFPF